MCFPSKPSWSGIIQRKNESPINYLYNFRSLSHYRYSTRGASNEAKEKVETGGREDDLFTRNVGFLAWTVRLTRKSCKRGNDSSKEEGRKRRAKRENFLWWSRRISLLPSPFSRLLYPFSPCSTIESINFSNFWSAAAAAACSPSSRLFSFSFVLSLSLPSLFLFVAAAAGIITWRQSPIVP